MYINFIIFLNLSRPNPIIIAAKVPPNTTIMGGIRNKASNEPPSQKNAPNIETIPRRRPPRVEDLPIISSPSRIYLIPARLLYKMHPKDIVSWKDQWLIVRHQ